MRENSYTFKYLAEDHPENNPDLAREHFHTSWELLYFLKGSGNFIIQQNSYRLKPHLLLVIYPGAYHNLILDPGSQYERIVIRFEETDVFPPLLECIPAAGGVYYIRGTHLSDELLRLSAHYREVSKEMHLPVFKSQLNIILAYLCQCEQLSMYADYEDTDVREIIDYIRAHLEEIQSMQQICQGLHMSKSLLQKRFSEYLQTSVMSYVRTQKCMLARSLLHKGIPATSVYLQCGFQDYSSFYRAYRNIFGCSPAKHQ